MLKGIPANEAQLSHKSKDPVFQQRDYGGTLVDQQYIGNFSRSVPAEVNGEKVKGGMMHYATDAQKHEVAARTDQMDARMNGYARFVTLRRNDGTNVAQIAQYQDNLTAGYAKKSENLKEQRSSLDIEAQKLSKLTGISKKDLLATMKEGGTEDLIAELNVDYVGESTLGVRCQSSRRTETDGYHAVSGEVGQDERQSRAGSR